MAMYALLYNFEEFSMPDERKFIFVNNQIQSKIFLI